MSWLEFIASMTGSLAWPLAAVAIAAIFRSQISSLLRRLNELGWGDAKATFAKELDKAEETAGTLPPPPPKPDAQQHANLPSPISTEQERFDKLLAISPSAAVVDAWQAVEEAIRVLATKHGISSSSFPNPTAWIRELQKGGHLPASVVTLINELRKTRNVAAHSDEVSVSDAIRFRELAERALAVLVTFREG